MNMLKVVPKDDSTTSSLHRSIAKNVLFSHLDEAEKLYNYYYYYFANS